MSSPDQSPAINSIGPSVPTLLPVLGGLTASGLPLIQNLSCACIKDKKCEEREEKEEERLLILFGGLTADGLPLVQNLVHSRAPLLSPTNVILTVVQQEESNKVKEEEVLQEASTKEGESVPQEVSTKEEAVLLEASTEEGEPVLQEVSTKEGESVLPEVSAKEGESVLQEVSTKEGESVLLEAPTKEGESVLQEASTEEGESVLPEVSAKEGESVLQEVSTKEGESVLQEVPTTEGESVLQEAPTKEGEPVLQEVSTKEEEPVLLEASTKEEESVLPEVSAKGESVLPETESTEQNQPGAPELSNTSIEKSIAPVVDSVEQKVEEAKEPHELVESAPLETPVAQEHTETVPAQQKLDKTRLEKLEQLENDLKQAFLPTQDVPTTNNQPLQTSRLSDEAFLANFLRQLAHFKMTDEEKYSDVVERLRQLEDELKISSSGLPPDPEFSELVGRILKSDYPNADLQIIVNSSRKTTTTKSFYETETPGMVGLNGDQIRELQVKLMGNISSPENAANQPDTTVPSDAVQRREVAEEGYAAPDGSEVVSKKMTRVVTTSQSTVSGLDEHPEAARDDVETVSIASTGSVRDRIAIFEAINEKLKHEKPPQPVHKITSEEITHPKAPITETTITETTIEKRYAEEERPVAPERVTVRETREVFHETMPEPTRETIETVIHEVHYTQPEEHAISPEPVEETYVEESFEHEIIPSEVQAHVEAKPYIEEMKPTETHLFKADEVPQREERYADRFEQEPTYQIEEEISQESEAIRRSPVREIEEVIESPSEIPQSDPEKVTIKNAGKPFILRRIANISIFTGPGDLTAELIDPEGLPVKVELVKVSPEDYNLSFLPVKLGTYELNLFLSGLQVPVTPTSITVEEQGKPYLYGPALDYGVEENQPVSLIFDPKESKGGIKIDVRSPSGEKVRHTTDRRSDGLTEILFLPTQPGKHLVSVDFNNRPIHGSPYQVTVFGVEKGHEHAEERHMEPIEEKHPEAIVKTPSHELPASFEEPEEQSVIISEERTYIRTLPSEVEEYPEAQLELNVITQEKIPERHGHAEERHIEAIEEKHPEAIVRTPSHEIPASFEEPEEQRSVIISEERTYIRTLPSAVEEYPEAQLNVTTQAYPEEKIPEHPDDVHEYTEERHMEPIEEKHPEALVKTPSHEISASFEEPEEQRSVIISEERTYIRTLPSEVEEYPEAQFEGEIDEKHVIEKEIPTEKHEAVASPTSYEQEYQYEREYSEEHDETGGISVPKMVAGAVVLGAMTIGEKIKSAVSGIGKGEEEEHGYEETKIESPSAEERTSYEERFPEQESPLEEHISRVRESPVEEHEYKHEARIEEAVRESPVEEHDEYKHEERIEEAPIQTSHGEHPSELEELSREPIEESPEIFRESPIQEHIVTAIAESLVEEHRSEFLKEEYPSEPESQEILSPLEEKFGREEIKESPLEEIPSEPIQGILEEEQPPKESHTEEISVSEQYEYPSEPIQEYHRELTQEKEYPEESPVEEIPSEPIQEHHRELVQEKEYPEISPVEEIPSEPIQELPQVEEPEPIQEKVESPEPQESPSEMAQNFPHEPTPESPEEESYVLTESQIIEAHESPSEIPQPDPEKVTIKNAGKPFILRRIANISIFTGPGDLTAELIDPEGLPVKVELVKVSPEDYNLSFLPVKLGTYELNLFLSGLQVPVTPTSITVEEQGKPYLYGPALDYGVEVNQPVSLIFDPKESKGGIKIDVRSPSGEKVRHTTDRRSDGSTEILFLPTQPGKHLVSVDFNNRPIHGSPYQVTVFGIEKVGGVEEEGPTKIPTGTEFEPEELVTKVELDHDVYPAGYEQRYQHETYEVYSEESQPRHEISIEEPEEEKSVIVSEERAYIRTLPTQIEELEQREPEIPQHERPFEEREVTHPPSYEQEYRHETLEHEYPDESGISVPKMVAGAVVLGAMAIGEKVKSAVSGLGRGERETFEYEEEPETIGGQHYIGQEEKVAREHLEEEPEYPIQPSDKTKNVLLEDLPPQEQWQYEYKEEEKPITPRGSPIREMEDQIEREFELHEEKYQMVESDSIPTAMDDEGKIDQEPVQESRLEEAPVEEEKIEIIEEPHEVEEEEIAQKPSQEFHTELAPESPTTSEEERDKIEAEYVTEAEKIRHSIEEIFEPAIVKESVEIVTYPAEEELEQESETVVEERKPETEIVESEEVPSYIPAESKMEPDGQFVLTDSYIAEDSRPIEETAYYSSETEVVQSEEVPIHMPEEAKHEPEGKYEESSPAYSITETDSYTAEERRPIEEVEQYPSEPERISKRLVEEVLVELKLGEEEPMGLVPEETEHGLVESEKVAEPGGYELSPKHKFEAEKEHPEEPELVQVQLESPAVVTCEYHVVESEEVPTEHQIETIIKASSKEFHEKPDSKISREPEHYEESLYEIAQKPHEQQQEYEAYPAGYDQEYQYREDFPEESGISVPKMVAGAVVLGAMAIGEKVKSAVSGIGKRGDTYGYEAVPMEDGEGEFPEERDKRISEREPMLSYEEEEAEEVHPQREEIFSDEQHKAVPYEAEVLRNEYQIIESEEIQSEHLHEEPRFDQEGIVHEPGIDQEDITHEPRFDQEEPEIVESEEVPSAEHEIRFEPEASHVTHEEHEETLVEKESFEPELVESEEVPSVEHEIKFEPEAASHATHEETLIEQESFEPELVESEEVPSAEREIRFEPEAASHDTREETLIEQESFEPELVESEEVPSVEHEIKFEPEAASHATHKEHVPAATPESEKFQTEFVESEEVDTEQPTPSGMPFTDFNENEQFIEIEEFKTKESALRDARLDESITEKESIGEDQEAIEHELVESETVEDVGQIPSSRLETDELEKREEEERPVHETEVKTIPTVEYQLVESESYTIEPNVEQKIESPIHETVPEGRTPEKDEVEIIVTEDIPTGGKYEEEIIICESPVATYLPSEEEEQVSEKQPTTPESPSRQYQMVESESVPLAIQHEPRFEPDSIQETPDGNYEQEYQEESGISVPKMVAGAIVLGAMSIGEKVKEAVSGIGKSAEYETESFVTEYRPTGSPEFPEESDYEHEKGAPEEHHIEPTKLVEEEYHVEPIKLEEEHHVHEFLPLSPKEVSDRLEKEIIEESLEKSYVEEEMVESEEIPGERYIETIFEPEVAHPVTPIPIEEQGGEKQIEEDRKVEILPEEYVESEEVKHGFEPQAHEQISHISIEETESGYLVESEEVPKESQFVEPKFETELPSTKESFEEITAPESYLREEIIESEEIPSGEAPKAIGEAPEAAIRQHEEFSPETEQRYEKESLESSEDQLTPEKETLVVSEYEVVESEEVPGEEFLEEPKFEQAPRKSLESEDLTSRTTSDEPRVSRQESVEREPTEEIKRVEIEEYSPEHPESGELRHEIETTSEPNEEFFEEEKPTRTTMEQESKLEPEDFEQQQAYESESPLLTEYHLVESEELPSAPIPEPSFEPEISEKREPSYEDEKPHEESGITEAVTPGFPEQVVEKVEERITPDQQLLEEYDVVESEEIPQEVQEHPKLSVATAPVEEYDYPEEPIPSGEEDQSGKVPYTVSAGSVYQEPTETVHRTYEEEEYPEEPEDSMSVPKMVAGAVVLGAMAIGERVKSAVSSLGKSEEGGSYQEIDERLSAREEFEHGGVPSQHERQFEELELKTGQVSHEETGQEEKSPISEHLSDKTIVLRETSETSFEDLQVDAPEDLLEMHGREETPEHEKEHEPSTPMVEHEHAARESPFQELHAPTPEDLLAIHEEEKEDGYEIIESEEIPQAKFVPEAHRESPREATPEELRVSTPEDLLEMHEGEQHEHPGERHEHPVIDSEESPKHEPEILATSEEPIEETQLRPTSGLSYEELEEAQRKSPIEEELSVIQVKSEELVDAALLKVLTEEEPQESTSPFEIVGSEDEALPQGDVPSYDRLESIEAELQPTQLVASGGLGVTELPSRPKSPVPPRFFQEPEAEPALESHEVDAVMETSLEKFETDSLNEDSGSPETAAAPTKAQKHVSTDNLSEGSLQEFERLELELVRRDESPSSIEAELEKNGAGSIAGSINSLTEFENLEREIQETVPDDAMMLSDIREEEEAEVMSIREDDEEDENADSLRETRVVDPMLVSYYGGEPMITSVDSLELAAHQQHLGMEISLDSLGASNQNYITDKDSLLEGVTSQENPSQDTQVLTGDTMGTYQEYQDEDDRDSLNEVIDSYPTTLTTFETMQVLDDGTAAQIIRRVQTRVTDPVHSHVRFTGTEDEAHLRSLPFDETVETVDEEGNITITTRKRAFS